MNPSFLGLVSYNPYIGGPKTFMFPWVLGSKGWDIRQILPWMQVGLLVIYLGQKKKSIPLDKSKHTT